MRICSIVSLTQLVYPSVALLAKLLFIFIVGLVFVFVVAVVIIET